MDDAGYIRPRVEALLDHSEEIYEVVPGPTNDFDTWSALKLILHSAGVSTYTKVHRNQGTGDLFYIDALAGTGLSTYKDGYFLGSALLAARATNVPFRKMYFVEGNNKKADVLEERLDYAFNLDDFTEPLDWDVIPGDTNDEMGQIVREIKDIGDYDAGFNYYCFVDNEGLDVKWSTMEELIPEPYGDLLINIPIAHPIGRLINRDDDSEKLNQFYGEDLSDVEFDADVRQQMLQRYLQKLTDGGRPMQVVSEVHGGTGSYRYDLAYVSRETKNQNPWLDAIRYVRDFIENFHGGDIERILDVVRGDQTSYLDYMPDDPIDEEAKSQLEEPDHNQLGLGDFS